MIISPTVSNVLRGIIHELGGPLKDGLDPVKSAQIETIIAVLGSCAMRAEYETSFINEEAKAVRALSQKYLEAGIASEHIRHCLNAQDLAEDSAAIYEASSQALSALSDMGRAAGTELNKELLELLGQRLTNEMQIIGGGFEAAGRG